MRLGLNARRLVAAGALALIALAARAQDAAPKTSRQYRQAAVEAYKQKDYARYRENLQKALELSPHHPTVLYNLAGAHALNGDGAAALAALGRVAAMGLVYPAARDEDFASVKGSAEFAAILKRFEANAAPISHSATAFTLAGKGLVTEGVAYDPADGTFYVSSVRERKIVAVPKQGAPRTLASARDGLWSALGMKVDPKRRILWACTAALPQMENFREEDRGRSGVLEIDLKTGKVTGTHLLPGGSGEHVLGDLAIDERGDVFASDSVSPAIYRISGDGGAPELFLGPGPFASPQGLAFSPDGKLLFVADYSMGVFAVDLTTKAATPLAQPDDMTLLGIDGLYFHDGGLIAIQNGVNPQRVVRLDLSRDLRRVEALRVLEQRNPAFDEPTLGVVVGRDFYYVANSQWGAVNEKGELAPPEKLREHVVLKLKL